MAKGLSDLQKWMLTRALENSASDLCKAEYVSGGGFMKSFDYHPVHIERNEIRADYYQFPVNVPWYRREQGVDRKWIRESRRAAFIKSAIPNYAAVNLAISRAHQRLIRRGLMTDQVGMWLTDKTSTGVANKHNGYPGDRPIFGIANTKGRADENTHGAARN
jgi:hypothetical protein